MIDIDSMKGSSAPLGSPEPNDHPRPSAIISDWIRSERASNGIADCLRELIITDGLCLPLPGGGKTNERFDALAQIGSYDLVLARLLEGHFDALAIIAESMESHETADALLGVWASGPLSSLRAQKLSDGWRLHGKRRWCSGASILSHALVSAEVEGATQLFLVDLSLPGISYDTSGWRAIGMGRSATFDVDFNNVEVADADAVGDGEFYLRRDGFWIGAIGVSAVWFGGALGVGSTLLRAPVHPSAHIKAHIGAVHSRLVAMEASLKRAGDLIDRASREPQLDIHSLALATRHSIEVGATEILERSGRALGAGPLCRNAAHAQRVADLEVYLRQSHAESDLEELGERIIDRNSILDQRFTQLLPISSEVLQ